MKTRIVGLATGFWMLGWGLAPAVAFFNTRPAIVEVSIRLPSESLDLSDLDVRDSLNRKITSIEKRTELKSLFVSGLNILLLNNLTPSALYQHELMSRTWNLFSGFFRAAAGLAKEMISSMTPDRRLIDAGLALRGAQLVRAPPNSAVPFGMGLRQSHLSSILSSTILLR